MKKKDLDEAYLEFMDVLKNRLNYSKKELDLVYYLQRKSDYSDPNVNNLIASVYCPLTDKDKHTYRKWKMGSDEEINLVDILRGMNEEFKNRYKTRYGSLIYENFDDFCEQLLKALDYIPTVSTKDLREYKNNMLLEMSNNVSRYNEDEHTFGIIDRICIDYEENAGYRWVLIELIIEGIKSLKFEDVYDFDLNKVNEIFDYLISLKDTINKIKDEMDNGTGYGSRLMALGLVSIDDLEKLSLGDFKIVNEEIEVAKNQEVWNLVIEERNREIAEENEVEADVEIER